MAKDAKRLWDQAGLLTERSRACQAEALDAGRRLEAARATLTEEVTRGAVTGKRDSTRESELVAEIQHAELEADPGILQVRYRALLSSQREAVQKAQSFIRANLADLIESEYRPLAEDAWTELENAETGDSRGALDAARAAYEDVRRKLGALEPWAFDRQAFVVPSSGLPLPPFESYTRPEARPLAEAPTFDPNTVKAAQVAPQLVQA